MAAAVGAALPETLVLRWDPAAEALPDAVCGRLTDAAAVVVGPGLETEATDAAVSVSRHVGSAVLVVDARAIPALGEPTLEQVARRTAAPNPSEAGRLLGHDPGDEPDVAWLAGALAELLGGPAAVRGAETVIDDGDGGQWVQQSPTPGLGTSEICDALPAALSEIEAATATGGSQGGGGDEGSGSLVSGSCGS